MKPDRNLINSMGSSAISLWPPLPKNGSPRSRRKICIASFDFVGPVKNGGVGTAFTSLGEALAAAGHDVTLLYLGGSWCENLTLQHWIANYQTKGIRFVPLPESGLKLNSRWNINRSYEAYLWLKEQKFDIIHSSEWKGPAYFALRAKCQGLAFLGTEFCIHTHGPSLWHKLSNAEYVRTVEDLETDYIERKSVELADLVVSPSQYLLRWMLGQGWTLPARCHVQQYVRPATARSSKADSSIVHRIDELVFFGRLEVRKGLVLFCDALDILAQEKVPLAKVAFLGKPDKIEDRDSGDYIAERATKWPWSWEVVTGRDQAGAMDYLQGPGRAAVIPSLVDNLPNTVLECLGAQVPFVASDAGGIPEMIAADDLPATCVPLRARALASKLGKVLNEGIRPARCAVDWRVTHEAWVQWHASWSARVSPVPTAASQAPRVSVCISHWNRPEYLTQALSSVEAQDYANIEVVLIDDGSTDAAALELLQRLEPEFAARGWQVLRNAENQYPGAARNRAARHARGDYLMFMDDDNVAKPHEISTFVRVAMNTGADIVTCCFDVFSGTQPPDPHQPSKVRWLFVGDDVASGAFKNVFGDTNGLWRRDVFLDSGGFHEDWGVGHEDWELLAKAVLAGRKLEVVPEALAWYRLNETEQTVNRKTPVHANHMANIRPYLAAVPTSLRNFVYFAQGASMHGATANESLLMQYVDLTVKWRSKLEGALMLAKMKQDRLATQMMLDAVNSVQSCGHPRVLIEALVEIPVHLKKFDPGRAKFLLGLAVQFAEKFRFRKQGDVAKALLAQMQTASAPGGKEAA